jgi:hypothetical protein
VLPKASCAKLILLLHVRIRCSLSPIFVLFIAHNNATRLGAIGSTVPKLEHPAVEVMSANPPNCGRNAIELLKHRVTSIKTDPLHSQAYLYGLKSYLDKPKAGSQHRPASVYVPQDRTLPFAYTYDLSQSARPLPKVYHTPSEYLFSGPECSSKVPSIIIFTGYPSPEWLEVVLARCSTGFPFLHRHLDFMSNNQRDWHIGSELPSRSTRVIRLLVPSIVFIGPEERHLPPQDLQKARRQCSDRLRQKSKSFFGGSSVSAGSSIIRNIHVHSGDTVVLEQMITITISRDGPQETGLSTYLFRLVQILTLHSVYLE